MIDVCLLNMLNANFIGKAFAIFTSLHIVVKAYIKILFKNYKIYNGVMNQRV